MKRAVLFLHGRYRSVDLHRFKMLTRDAFLVAVDGGYRFFRKTNKTPDLLLGDFDSLRRIPKNLSTKTKVVRVEVRKDQTDAELALVYCLNSGYREIDIVQPSHGDLDHQLGNLMLLRLVERRFGKKPRRPTVRLVSRNEEVRLIKDRKVPVPGAVGDRVSVVPLSSRVVYSCSGTDYNVREVTLRPGDTLGLRNRITAELARFSVEGEALLIRSFGQE
jgi:thiamine pyrophosphokinase